MPRSGPGRSRRLLGSSKWKKKSEKLLENRKLSIAAMEQGVTIEGKVPSDDVRAMVELNDKVTICRCKGDGLGQNICSAEKVFFAHLISTLFRLMNSTMQFEFSQDKIQQMFGLDG